MSVAEYFAGQTVLLTGGTGSVGSVLLEKLLRSCKGLHRVYLLVRPRNGVTAAERVRLHLQIPLFSLLDKTDVAKVHVASGDVTLERLGLTPEDHYLLTSEVTLVFHAAARVFFNASLKSAVSSNLVGTKRVLELCHQMAKLESLVYVSTAYCNCTIPETRERLYPIEHNPLEIIDFVEKNPLEEVERCTKKLIGNHPNTYTFTKQLAEHLLNDGREHIKLAIVRPSIVLGTWQEPFPGWIDGTTGATGFIAGAGVGCFRVSQVAPGKVADLVPSDILANALVTAAWNLAQPMSPSFRVVHVTSGLTNPITWGQYTKFIARSIQLFPTSKMLWLPVVRSKRSEWRNAVAVRLFQLWPSYLLDALRMVFSTKQKESLVAIQQKFIRGMVHTRYFCTRQWQFHAPNLAELASSLSPDDRERFPLSVERVDWGRHLQNCVLGVREHFHKDPPSTLPQARETLKKLRVLHFASQLVIFAWLTYLMTFVFADLSTSLVASVTMFLFLLWV